MATTPPFAQSSIGASGSQLGEFQQIFPVQDAAGANVNLTTSGQAGAASVISFIISKVVANDASESGLTVAGTALASGAQLVLTVPQMAALRVGTHEIKMTVSDSTPVTALVYMVSRGNFSVSGS